MSVLLLWGWSLLTQAPAWAEDPVPAPTSFLTPKMDDIVRTSMKVIEEREGIVSVALPGQRSLANQTQILFFRRKNIRLEMIATGKVKTEEREKSGRLVLKVELDKEGVVKYPREGDFAAPMADPTAIGAGDKKDNYDFFIPEEDEVIKTNPLPGYLSGGIGLFWGNLQTTPVAFVNQAKTSTGYRFSPMQINYFTHLLPLGIEYESYKGNFPTSTREGKVVKSSEAVSWLGFTYRFKPMLDKKLELQLRMSSLTDTFTTDNTDESLISSTLTGTGFGAKAVFVLKPNLWKREKGEMPIQLQSVFIEALYYPFVTITDTTISRGSSSSGSKATQLRAGATILAWFDFIPILKRWYVEGSIGLRTYSMKFSGATDRRTDPTPILQNGTGSETHFDSRIIFGVRFEDPIKSIFYPDRGKK